MAEPNKVTSLAWRKFLDSEAGKDGMDWLRQQKPAIIFTDPHKTVYTSGYSEGFWETLKKIDELLAAQQAKKNVNYENP